MNRLLTIAASAALAAVSASAALAGSGDGSFEMIERGRNLATLGDCAACHSAPGGKPYAGGVPIETPFGRLVGANITPDVETGIGTWTLDDFQKAMSEGIAKGGYHLYGAMPFTAYTKVTKQDNAAIWAYLQSLQPVSNAVEANQLPFPFNIRTTLYAWNFLNFNQGEFVADPAKSAEWNRGAYLVEGLGHCGTCHTPKTLTGGDVDGAALKGGVVDSWLAPDITSNAHTGIGSWTMEEITQYLKTGSNRYDIASGPMAEEVENSSQHWADADLKAVATYLKATDPGDTKAPEPIAASDTGMLAGKAIYADRCSGCHTPKGEGVPGLFPRLADAPLVNNAEAQSLIRVVLAGSKAGSTEARPTSPAMPSFAWNLSDADIANVLSYVRNSWGNAAPPVTPDAVADLRGSLR